MHFLSRDIYHRTLLLAHTHFFYFFRKLFIKKGVNDWVCDVIQNINTANKQTDLEKKRELLPAQNNVIPCFQQHDGSFRNISNKKNDGY